MVNSHRPGAPVSQTPARWARISPPVQRHVIIFHLVTQGQGYARIEEDGRTMPFEAGDIIIFPQGHAHFLGNGHPVTPIDSSAEVRKVLAEGHMIS
jgi:mannose-6-phosphate isomerase-like protein (cupin superfamily)